MHGILVYNDDDAILAEAQTAHVAILTRYHSSVRINAVCPPMAFIELRSDKSFVVHQGVIDRHTPGVHV